MPRYEVIVTKDVTMSRVVVVDAPTQEAADDKALVAAGPYGNRLTGWALDEGNMNRVYIGDPGNARLVPDKTTPVFLHRGDDVRFRGSLKELGLTPSPEQSRRLEGVLKVERADATPVDGNPSFQTVFVEGLPWMFNNDVLELMY